MGDEAAYETIIEGSKTTEHKYISGNGRYLARVEKVNGGTEQVSYYHTDHLGSIRAVSNADASTMTYDAFGKLLDYAGAAQDHDYRFTGKPSDSTGLSYYGAHFYDPELGRFINQDPARDGANWYVYCANNPLKYVDPTGLCPVAMGSRGIPCLCGATRVTVDAGHGYGARFAGTSYQDVIERDVVLAISRKVVEGLADEGIRGILTRNNDNSPGEPSVRGRMANAHGSAICICIHLDMRTDKYNGVTVYAKPGSTEGIALAECIIDGFKYYELDHYVC